jgi:hypothetical protein
MADEALLRKLGVKRGQRGLVGAALPARCGSGHVRRSAAAAAVALLAALAGCAGGDADGRKGGPPSSGAQPAGDAGKTSVSAVWSSGPQGAPRQAGAGGAVLLKVRAARQDGFDRLVFEFRNGLPGYQARYVDRVSAAGGGTVELEGSAYLLLAFDGASAGDADLAQRDLRPGFGSMRQVRLVDQGGGRVRFAVGVDAVAGYLAHELTGPDRVIIDIAA